MWDECSTDSATAPIFMVNIYIYIHINMCTYVHINCIYINIWRVLFQNAISTDPKIEFAMSMPHSGIMFDKRALHKYEHIYAFTRNNNEKNTPKIRQPEMVMLSVLAKWAVTYTYPPLCLLSPDHPGRLPAPMTRTHSPHPTHPRWVKPMTLKRILLTS